MKKLLLIDAGNTRVKWGVSTTSPQARIKPEGETPTERFTAQNVHALARRYAEHHLVLACVVPRLRPFFQKVFSERWTNVEGTLPALQLKFAYPKPRELGADRLACAVAAREQYRGAVIIIACGTANAFTVLDEQGRLCGGVISPGLHAQFSALVRQAAQLHSVKLEPVRGVLGKSTRSALQIGALLSFRGGVREIIESLSREFSAPPQLLLTGGNAGHLGRDFPISLGQKVELKPLLVFEGLRIIGQRVL